MFDHYNAMWNISAFHHDTVLTNNTVPLVYIYICFTKLSKYFFWSSYLSSWLIIAAPANDVACGRVGGFRQSARQTPFSSQQEWHVLETFDNFEPVIFSGHSSVFVALGPKIPCLSQLKLQSQVKETPLHKSSFLSQCEWNCVSDEVRKFSLDVGLGNQPRVWDGVPPVPQTGEVREVSGPRLHSPLPASLHQPG